MKNKDLWEQSRDLAKKLYEEEHGSETWCYAYKHEREDYYWTAYKQILENENNKNNKKENETMTNANNTTNNTENKSKKELRMEILAAAGVDTSKYFNLNLSNIPHGVPVTVEIGGMKYNLTPSVEEKVDFISVVNEQNYDEIEKSIMNSGYVFNRRTDGRFIVAQTFEMLNTPVYDYDTKEKRCDWNLYLKNRKSYMYQFDMMKEEIHRLAKMEKENDPEFERLSSFFTKEVVVATCKNYMKKLRKYLYGLKTYNHKGKKYVKIPYYGQVHCCEFYEKIFNPLQRYIKAMENTYSYAGLESYYNIFYCNMIKLPFFEKKYSLWKDAYKGKGAYVTLLNLVKFHDVKIFYKSKYQTEEQPLDMYKSVEYIEDLLVEYKKTGQLWRFHELLVKTIKDNNFNLKESIEMHKENK